MITYRQLIEAIEKWLGNSGLPKRTNGFTTHEEIEKNFKTAKAASRNLHDQQDLSPKESGSVRTYIAGHTLPENKFVTGYKAINGHLRGTLKSDAELGPQYEREIAAKVDKSVYENHVNNIDSAIAKHTTKHNLHAWRGFHSSVGIQDLKPGDTFHDKGYVSTTTDPVYAKNFRDTFAHIKIPKGSKAMAINKYHSKFTNEQEHEVILPRNSRFKYEGSTEDVSGRTIHHMTHLPETEST